MPKNTIYIRSDYHTPRSRSNSNSDSTNYHTPRKQDTYDKLQEMIKLPRIKKGSKIRTYDA